MPLKKPTDEDIRKINAETSQIVHQRFLITTIAITLFGVMTAFLIPNSPPTVGTDVGAFTCACSTLISLLLFTLFLVSHLLRSMLRTFTTYLIITRKSNWEYDWEIYRKANIKEGRWVYLGYTKPLSFIFIVLSIITTFYPFIFSIAYSLKLNPLFGFGLNLSFGLICIILIAGMGFLGWWDPEPKAKARWEELDKKSNMELLNYIMFHQSNKKMSKDEWLQMWITVIVILFLIIILSFLLG